LDNPADYETLNKLLSSRINVAKFGLIYEMFYNPIARQTNKENGGASHF
jgi:hypothetical protein